MFLEVFEQFVNQVPHSNPGFSTNTISPKNGLVWSVKFLPFFAINLWFTTVPRLCWNISTCLRKSHPLFWIESCVEQKIASNWTVNRVYLKFSIDIWQTTLSPLQINPLNVFIDFKNLIMPLPLHLLLYISEYFCGSTGTVNRFCVNIFAIFWHLLSTSLFALKKNHINGNER